MKVVLFCGGFGTRMRSGAPGDVPKPMQLVGPRPLIWHVMRYYAHFGHKEFVLCLGYGAHHVVDYFRCYDETRSNDFVLRAGGQEVELLTSDISDWTITFIHTGLDTPIGERLRRVRRFVENDDVFAANYAPLRTLIRVETAASGAVGSLLAVPPQAAFHMVRSDEQGYVQAITPVSALDVEENGGYFFFTPGVFDVLAEGEDLVTDALPRLAAQRKLLAFHHRGFWKPADTVKERSELDSLARHHHRPWAAWDEARSIRAEDGAPTGPC